MELRFDVFHLFHRVNSMTVDETRMTAFLSPYSSIQFPDHRRGRTLQL